MRVHTLRPKWQFHQHMVVNDIWSYTFHPLDPIKWVKS